MNICEHEAKTGSGQVVYCDRTATIKHHGKWFCEWCYDLETCGFCETGIQDNPEAIWHRSRRK